MIRAIAAIDIKRGMANDLGIPWVLPTDKTYFRTKTEGSTILMGYKTYEEFLQPLPNRRNVVSVRPGSELRTGFVAVEDTTQFLRHASEDIWVIGGAKLFADSLEYLQELYLTELSQDFHCTKFFPEFRDSFQLKQKGNPIHENGITFRFNVYERIS